MNIMRCAMSAAFTLTFAAAFAEPCTLYKPADLANAKENVERHAWARKVVTGWQRRVAYTMSKDRPFFEAFIPELTPWTAYGNNCPGCVGKQSSMGEIGLYTWSVENPDQLVCKYCGTVYPNDDYPETGRLECPRMGQTFSYYLTQAERDHPDDTSGKYAFRWARWPVHSSWTGLIRLEKARWCAGQAPVLAKLYAVTGDVAYAERCVWIMDRFARCYPGWLYHSYNGTFADCPPAEAAAELGKHPRAGRFPKEVIRNPCGLHQFENHAELNVGFWGAGRYATGSAEGSMLLGMTVAYDLIKDARRADGTSVMLPAERERIVNDLILAGCADRENWNAINNKAGPNRALSAAVGILFEQPASAHRALDGFEQLLSRCFHADGFCRESPSYSGMHLRLMADIPIILRGYSDPVDYEPTQRQRLDGFDPFEHIPRYRLAQESMVRMTAPNRRPPFLGDTHYRTGISTRSAAVLTYFYDRRYAGLLEGVMGVSLDARGGEYDLWFRPADLTSSGPTELPLHSEWFPGWQVGVLRGRDPHGPLALYLNGYAYHGHRHDDTLGLVVYAFGKELASDRGYIWDDPRNAWTRSTLAHNLVTVDNQSQVRKGRSSTLELFGRSSLVQIIQASANAYQQCDVYRRTCALVPLSAEDAYVIDVFTVSGGKTHSYGFQCNGTLDRIRGVDLTALDRSHRWLKDFRAGIAEEPVTMTWRDNDAYLDLTLLSRSDQVVVADAPGWRSDKGSQLNAPAIQQLFAETQASEGQSALSTTSVAVIAPHRGVSPIREATLVEAEDGTVVVRVERAGVTDILLLSSNGEGAELGDISLAGHVGFVRRHHDRASEMYLLDGTSLQAGTTRVELPGDGTRFEVISVDGRTLTLKRPLPDGMDPRNTYVLAGNTGYEVSEVDGTRVTVRDYPVQTCKSISVLKSAAIVAE